MSPVLIFFVWITSIIVARARTHKYVGTLTQPIYIVIVIGRTPRWVEFWSEAAIEGRRRNWSCSSATTWSSPERCVEVGRREMPRWVEGYIGKIGCVLREGGWGESEIREMVEVAAGGMFEGGGEAVLVDNQAVLDALLLKVDKLSDSLRKAGWSSEEVSDALGFDFRPEKDRKPAVKLSPQLVEKIGKLVESVSRS